jgi:hypothetical protein
VEAKTESSQDQRGLHREFEASLGNTARPFFKRVYKKKKDFHQINCAYCNKSIFSPPSPVCFFGFFFFGGTFEHRASCLQSRHAIA